MKQSKKQNRNRRMWLPGAAIMFIAVMTIYGGMWLGNSKMSVVYAGESAEETAKEQSNDLQMLYTNTDTHMYAKMSENSEVVQELSAGTVVIAVEERGGWIRVRVGEREGYVKATQLQSEHPDTAVWEEMDDLEEYNTAFINEIERLAAEKRRSRIFGAVIIVLIVAIFGVGIFSTLRKRKQAENSSDADGLKGDGEKTTEASQDAKDAEDEDQLENSLE